MLDRPTRSRRTHARRPVPACARRLGGVLGIALLASGCASTPPAPSEAEPAEPARPANTAGIRTRHVAPIPLVEFDNPLEPVDARVEVCVPPSLRRREWNVPGRAYRIALGQRTVPNVERMAKAVFSDVAVTFDPGCGATTGLPWFQLEVRSAHRDRAGRLTDGRVRTEVTVVTRLRDPDGRSIWQHEVTSSVSHAPGFGDDSSYMDEPVAPLLFPFLLPVTLPTVLVQSRMGVRAGDAFAEAMAEALAQTFDALVAAPEVRNALERRPTDTS